MNCTPPPETVSQNRLSEDRRRHKRRETRILSSMIVIGPQGDRTCLIHNVSEGGALIEVSGQSVPATFILEDADGKLRRPCRVVWQCGALAGVAFLRERTG